MKASFAFLVAFLLAGLAAACASPANGTPTADAGISGDPERCAACHLDDFRAVKNPVHVGAKPDTCAVCHTQDAWRPSRLDHPFALTGAHAGAPASGSAPASGGPPGVGSAPASGGPPCLACHVGSPPKFVGTPTACVGCHRDDYDRAPDHLIENFPTTCDGCHRTTAWSDRLPKARPTPTPRPTPSARPAPSGSTPRKTTPTPTPPRPDVTTHASPKW